MPSILIVDDEDEILKMLKELFTMESYLVYTARNGAEALEKIGGAAPDVILLDINMPEADGYQVCSRIREYVSCPILFLTARISEEDKVQGFRVGGDDYIEKPFSILELKERVAAHIRRQRRLCLPEQVGFAGGFTLSYSNRQVFYGKEAVPFTRTEYEIVELLSRNRNRVYTKEMIYESLWGQDKNGDSSIITEHIRRIRAKLKKYTQESLIETVWGVGYRWIG